METITSEVLDIGCGRNKTPGAYGVDTFLFPNVDRAFDFDVSPWPIPSNQFRHVVCRHVIEHCRDIAQFMGEIHRVSKDGALVEMITPHFSCIDSWSDPTHRYHLSWDWAYHFEADKYLGIRVGAFKVEQQELTFYRSARSWLTRLMIKIIGVHSWEKYYCHIMPAKYIKTRLRVIKNTPQLVHS